MLSGRFALLVIYEERVMAKKVLVVDDEKLIVKGIRFSLEQDGMEVDCAYDGEEALNMAREHEYDMILLDIMLPKMDGMQVCQQIREFSSVPIIMLTAKGEDMIRSSSGIRSGRLYHKAVQYSGGKGADQGNHAPHDQTCRQRGKSEGDSGRGSEAGLRRPPRIYQG